MTNVTAQYLILTKGMISGIEDSWTLSPRQRKLLRGELPITGRDGALLVLLVSNGFSLVSDEHRLTVHDSEELVYIIENQKEVKK